MVTFGFPVGVGGGTEVGLAGLSVVMCHQSTGGLAAGGGRCGRFERGGGRCRLRRRRLGRPSRLLPREDRCGRQKQSESEVLSWQMLLVCTDASRRGSGHGGRRHPSDAIICTPGPLHPSVSHVRDPPPRQGGGVWRGRNRRSATSIVAGRRTRPGSVAVSSSKVAEQRSILSARSIVCAMQVRRCQCTSMRRVSGRWCTGRNPWLSKPSFARLRSLHCARGSPSSTGPRDSPPRRSPISPS